MKNTVMVIVRLKSNVHNIVRLLLVPSMCVNMWLLFAYMSMVMCCISHSSVFAMFYSSGHYDCDCVSCSVHDSSFVC